MKKVILILTCVLLGGVTICRAQVAGQFNAELGGNYYSVEEDDSFYDMYGPSVSLSGGVRLCEYLFVGVMTGLNLMIDQGQETEVGGLTINTTWYRKYLFPVDLNMRGYIPMSRTAPFHLYVDVAAGPIFHYEKYYYVDGSNVKGFHLKTGLGISYKKFSFTMGWERFQQQESVYARVGVTLGRYTR